MDEETVGDSGSTGGTTNTDGTPTSSSTDSTSSTGSGSSGTTSSGSSPGTGLGDAAAGALGGIAGSLTNGAVSGLTTGAGLAGLGSTLQATTGWQDPKASTYTNTGLSGLQSTATNLGSALNQYLPGYLQTAQAAGAQGQTDAANLDTLGGQNQSEATMLENPSNYLVTNASNTAANTAQAQNEAQAESLERAAAARGATPGSSAYYLSPAQQALSVAGSATSAATAQQAADLAAASNFSQLAGSNYTGAAGAAATGANAEGTGLVDAGSAENALAGVNNDMVTGGNNQTAENINVNNNSLASYLTGMGLSQYATQNGIKLPGTNTTTINNGTAGTAGTSGTAGTAVGSAVGNAVTGLAKTGLNSLIGSGTAAGTTLTGDLGTTLGSGLPDIAAGTGGSALADATGGALLDGGSGGLVGAGLADAGGAALGDAAGAGLADAAGSGLLDTIGSIAGDAAVVGWVVCTELLRQGKLPKRFYVHGAKVFAETPPTPLRGYYIWAVPAVHHMRAKPDSAFTKFLETVFNWRAEHLAHQAGCKGARNLWRGKVVTKLTYGLCYAIGALAPETDWKVLYK